MELFSKELKVLLLYSIKTVVSHLNLKVIVDLQEGPFEKCFVLVSLLPKLYKIYYRKANNYFEYFIYKLNGLKSLNANLTLFAELSCLQLPTILLAQAASCQSAHEGLKKEGAIFSDILYG